MVVDFHTSLIRKAFCKNISKYDWIDSQLGAKTSQEHMFNKVIFEKSCPTDPKHFTKADLAFKMKRNLPVSLLGMIDDGSWPGQSLLISDSDLARPTATEIAQNYVILKPVVERCPCHAT